LEAFSDPSLRLARRAYEVGRLLVSLRRAAAVTLLVAFAGYVASGERALLWLPLTMTAWTLAFWRGESVLRGAWSGLFAGAVTLVLPMSILRPCCAGRAMNPGADCCTMPGMCLLAGAVVGFALALLLPQTNVTPRGYWKTVAGTALGVVSIAVLRCATLFAGEAIGLVGGVVAAMFAASAARVLLARRAAA
jgi:hypothetical protein